MDNTDYSNIDNIQTQFNVLQDVMNISDESLKARLMNKFLEIAKKHYVSVINSIFNILLNISEDKTKEPYLDFLKNLINFDIDLNGEDYSSLLEDLIINLRIISDKKIQDLGSKEY